MPNTVDFSLYLITDRHQVATGRTLLTTTEAALKGGVKAVQLREKDLSVVDLKPLAVELRALTKAYQAKLLLNHHVELALEIAADGVHLGGQSLPTAVVRKMIGPDKLIGVSTHNRQEIDDACKQGADFVTFGPVYSTPSKAAYGPPQGLQALSEVCRDSALPVYALGGITTDNAGQALAAGASGIALISAIIASPSPREAARAFSA